MVYTTHIFLFYFLPLFLAGYFVLPRSWRNLWITTASYVFYGWWEPWFVCLMMFTTGDGFHLGSGHHAARRHAPATEGRGRRVRGNIPDDLLYEGGLFTMRESTLQAMMAESPATTYSDDQLRAARPLGDLPVVVLTADSSLQSASNWEMAQKNLVALSTNSRWTIVENSLHNIAFDDSDAVIAAVQDVIQSAQTGQPLASK